MDSELRPSPANVKEVKVMSVKTTIILSDHSMQRECPNSGFPDSAERDHVLRTYFVELRKRSGSAIDNDHYNTVNAAHRRPFWMISETSYGAAETFDFHATWATHKRKPIGRPACIQYCDGKNVRGSFDSPGTAIFVHQSRHRQRSMQGHSVSKASDRFDTDSIVHHGYRRRTSREPIAVVYAMLPTIGIFGRCQGSQSGPCVVIK
ncbi:hypothetical protein HPB50_009706 [Hyalomma asiaticum]|uniref:Uncharacterized protein n=1 Tax=Hyalomma asiaticum TaxID=266040 RepID=A0ACB7SGA1_HYAAI|nr:hypothetical protein HPB50_009706 [Hyalomma asiaticum]